MTQMNTKNKTPLHNLSFDDGSINQGWEQQTQGKKASPESSTPKNPTKHQEIAT